MSAEGTIPPELIAKALKIKEILARTPSVKSGAKIGQDGAMKRVFRRALRSLCQGNVRVIKRVPRDPLEQMSTRMRLEKGLGDHAGECILVPDVRDEVVRILGEALLTEYQARQKTGRETSVPVGGESPQQHRPSL